MICSSCGAQLQDGAVSCASCGVQLGGEQSQAGSSEQEWHSPFAQPQPQYAQSQYAQPQYAQPVSGDSQKSKVAAGLLALFLGGWGVHKFYLGYTKEGAIMLGAWLVGLVLIFIGIGLLMCMAVSILALVEAIMYLTKSDEEFNRTYVQGNKPWL